jgi:hypothetical protein
VADLERRGGLPVAEAHRCQGGHLRPAAARCGVCASGASKLNPRPAAGLRRAAQVQAAGRDCGNKHSWCRVLT